MAMWSLAWLGATLEAPELWQPRSTPLVPAAARWSAPTGASSDRGAAARTSGAETLEDVAWVVAGFVEMYQADGDPAWLETAARVVRNRLPRYQGDDGALLETPDDGEPLPFRPRNATDGATPASAAVLARSLVRLAALTGDASLAAAVPLAVRADAAVTRQFAAGATTLIAAAAESASPPTELVVVGNPDWPSTQALLAVARRAPRPPLVLAPAPAVPVPSSVTHVVTLFEGRERVTDRTALAYLCSGGVCELPTRDPRELARKLSGPHAS